MPLLVASNLVHRFGTREILAGAAFGVEPGEKIGLLGRNGCGKTTLLRVLAGIQEADSGQLDTQRGSRIGMLPQHPTFDEGLTVRDVAAGAFAELERVRGDLEAVYEAMGEAQGEKLDGLLKRQTELEAQLEAAGGWQVDHLIEATLHGLGFQDEEFSQQATTLSGGQKSRLALAKLLLEQPDLLLLDEPTNHLDLEGRQWLETFLAEEFPGAVIVVSHDRWLLDRVVHRILELDRGRLLEYPGNYTAYKTQRAELEVTRQRAFKRQQDHVRREEAFIRRYKAGQRAKQARGRESRLERFRDDMEAPLVPVQVADLTLPTPPRSGDIVLDAQDVGTAWGEHVVMSGLGLTVQRGERIGIIGPNGSGKTTLVRCLLGEIQPSEGQLKTGTRLKIGWFRQEQEALDPEDEVWEWLRNTLARERESGQASEQEARDLAGAFLFSGTVQEQLIHSLSGGEKSRLVLASLVGGGHNVLVLDEPTNHLDLPSAEQVEVALSAWEGTLLLISHDRALLEGTCDRLVALDGKGSAAVFEGRLSDWFRARDRATAKPEQAAPRKTRAATPAPAPAAEPKNPLAKLSIRKLEEKIEHLEQRRGEIDADLARPEIYTDGEAVKRLSQERQEIESSLGPLEDEWQRRAE
ncbi:MAG: ABC-F family ATP-binding cassette domain-containing protein [Phycisphaerales bacterium]|nr:ABC-F family ATP-binding cassette domain-containing protein [Phycisphaerales bacterium]